MTLHRIFPASLLLPVILCAQGEPGLEPSDILKPLKDSWPTYNGDYTGRRYSALTQIDQNTVKNLTLAWFSKSHLGRSQARDAVAGAVGTSLLAGKAKAIFLQAPASYCKSQRAGGGWDALHFDAG